MSHPMTESDAAYHLRRAREQRAERAERQGVADAHRALAPRHSAKALFAWEEEPAGETE
jgi:hypothetical protein